MFPVDERQKHQCHAVRNSDEVYHIPYMKSVKNITINKVEVHYALFINRKEHHMRVHVVTKYQRTHWFTCICPRLFPRAWHNLRDRHRSFPGLFPRTRHHRRRKHDNRLLFDFVNDIRTNLLAVRG